MFENITIRDIIDIIYRKWWVVVLGMLTMGLIAFLYSSFLVTPLYISEGTLYVNNKSDQAKNLTSTSVNALDLSVALKLVDTYKIILKSDTFMEMLKNQSGLPYTYKQIKKMVSISTYDETEIMKISVISKSRDDANLLAQTILENAKYEITRVVEGGSVKIIDVASYPDKPSSPNIPKNTILGMFMGIIISILIIIVLKTLNISIKSEEDIERYYDIPIIGNIPNLESQSTENYYVYEGSE